jgi:phenylalanyl-tRNA synthetase beta chain
MKFSYSWLGEYVELPPLFSDKGARAEASAVLAQLSADLTSIGLNVESHELTDADAVLDVEVTSNRPDCMNHFGLAREIAVKRRSELRKPVFPFTESLPQGGPRLSVKIEDPEGCSRYTARVVRGVRIGPSPDWLAKRLEAIGSRSINNVVDATNFVLWESGQPIHAFDLATIPNAEIRVRRARAGEKLTTLDGKARLLDPEVLVIADGSRAIALAGIMGGLDTEVTGKTIDILIESAHFDRRRTRIGAKRLGLHTDASHRFERGADPEGCDEASKRCAALIVELAGGTIETGAVDARGAARQPVSWTLSGPAVERFGGVAISDAEIERILAGLGFAPRKTGERALAGEVPSWREVDFEPRGDRSAVREAWPQDMFEEVLRHAGFDAIPATLPLVAGVDEGENPGHDRRDRLRDLLAGFGLAEAIHYAFIAREADAALPRLVGDGEPLALANPLSELYAVLRRSLVPGLVTAAEFNANRGAQGVALFESGHLFPGGSEPEVEALSIIAGGVRGGPWDAPRAVDLLTLKGVVDAIAEELGAEFTFRPAELPGIAAGSGALLRRGGEIAGYIGRVERSETPFPLFAGELLLDRLPMTRERIRVEPPSRYPGVDVDLTLTHGVDVAWSELEQAIAGLAVADLRSFALKDRYQGQGVPAGAVATTIAFHYNATDRSLTQAEVNERHAALAAALEARYAVAREEKR